MRPYLTCLLALVAALSFSACIESGDLTWRDYDPNATESDDDDATDDELPEGPVSDDDDASDDELPEGPVSDDDDASDDELPEGPASDDDDATDDESPADDDDATDDEEPSADDDDATDDPEPDLFEGNEPGECDNGIDDNGNGDVDCNDIGCAGAPVCSTPSAESICDDGIDEDLDGDMDCDDSDCFGAVICDGLGDDDDSAGDDDDSAFGDDDDSASEPPVIFLPESVCDDGADNDVDGLFDCDDPDCVSELVCIDDDADGANADIDCDDSDPLLNLDDSDGDGVTSCGLDCDDSDDTVYPGAILVTCDNGDQNCDGISDEEELECVEDDLAEGLDWIRVNGNEVGLAYEDTFVTLIDPENISVTGTGINSSWSFNASYLTTYGPAGFLWYPFSDGQYRVTWRGPAESAINWAEYGTECSGSATASVLCHQNVGPQGAGYSLCFEVVGGLVGSLDPATCSLL